jgi:hypothetical protein
MKAKGEKETVQFPGEPLLDVCQHDLAIPVASAR